ncbi:hypothetical protein [Microbispora bryophytorum]|uniref:hypothetical protein n=1 Tax=Microbispora bryophytorum TaxID=1460882 RepID=UPI0033DCC440
MRAPLALAGLALALTACGTSTATTGTQPPPSAAAAAPVSEPAPEITPTPAPSDYDLTAKVLRKACFGSAGCNIDYSIRVAYSGPQMPADATYQVTYKVTGGEDEMINTFEITGDQVSVPAEESVSTYSSASKLRAKVTDVELA